MRTYNSSKKSGQSLIEFALILPLFILLVMFVFDMGRAVYYYSVLHNVVREGARLVVVGETNLAKVENIMVKRAYGMELEPGAGINISTFDDLVYVEANYNFEPVTPVVGAFLPGGDLFIQAEVTMRLEFNP